MVARERIVDVDDAARGAAWIADLLPDELAPSITALIEQAWR